VLVSRKLDQTAASPRWVCTILAAGSARGQAHKALACLRADSVTDDGAASRVRGLRRRAAPALDPAPPSHRAASLSTTGAHHARTNTALTLAAYAAAGPRCRSRSPQPAVTMRRNQRSRKTEIAGHVRRNMQLHSRPRRITNEEPSSGPGVQQRTGHRPVLASSSTQALLLGGNLRLGHDLGPFVDFAA
jgi:hypothetical protein